ncbi:uncharacterized protein JN550_010244 [Neoarthrinium moseri]|uniref:uncharacterized protein n=1 Tax=Neoarthrinium moseri TaxID=1658444 RepID=UPI001FDDF0F2|nr:uncharacterized protein JN550_010244 [Neoarthrinium moseri]KAI1862382.1 hypothetical protein JN550_010244 [Neoarthrinium moseri]
MYRTPTSEPIAIIGNSCRFAGSATSPSKLWEVLSAPPDLSKEVPQNRFNAAGFYHHDGEYHGTTNSVKAYWLEQDHRVFDTAFFNITPKEAEAIDPQQRMLLEVVYEAMESAGYTLDGCSGKNIAVFAGVMTADYDTLSQRDELSASQYYATGNARSIISNRISYFFNLHGPSMTIDTACSSSLVALHQAVLSLRSGECTMAYVAGVNLMITPEQFIVESSLHMLSPSGKSRMWDKDADGYARGEGVAALLLKPLSRALQDRDSIIGVIRETGVNSDGRTKGITMPNPIAQAALIKATYTRSGLDPRQAGDQCQYFEAHGTGTQAGDPKEAEAIHEAFFGPSSSHVDLGKKMLVGSIKTVIGHTEGAAGLAGVLKVLQAMKNGAVPPNLHLDTLNPSIKPFYKHIEIPTTLVPWPETPVGQPKRASVNSFGFGGTNSHAIIEAYMPEIHNQVAFQCRTSSQTLLAPPHKPYSSQSQLSKACGMLPIGLSASSQKSLAAVVAVWRKQILRHPDITLNEISWHLLVRQSALPYRLSMSARSTAEAVVLLDKALDKFAQSGDIGLRPQPPGEKPRILGIFTGQGAQWPTMSRALLLSNSRYRQTIRDLDHALQSCPNPPAWRLEEQLLNEGASSRIHEAEISQPVCTAIQLGLVDLLSSLGVTFHTVIGHSSGEIAAAYAAGRLTSRDAILISYYRGLYAYLAGGPGGEKGGMMAAGLSENEALGFCRDPIFNNRIFVAASNAPLSVTLSGDQETIELAKDKLIQQNKFARIIHVDTAYHSPHMTQPAIEYTKALRNCDISPLSGRNEVRWVSSVYGFSPGSERDLGAEYWKDNMVHAVQFKDALIAAVEGQEPFDCALEIGPHPALQGPVTQTLKASAVSLPYAGVLERSKDDLLAFSNFLGFLWCHLGPSAIDWRRYAEQSNEAWLAHSHVPDAPTYPWDHSQFHYRESRLSRQYHFKEDVPHELLGVRTRDDNQFELRWRNILRLEKIPWLEHHSFQGQALVPASAYCIMAFDAAHTLLKERPATLIEIKDLDILSGISVEPDAQGTEVMFTMSVTSGVGNRGLDDLLEAKFSLSSCAADGSTTMKRNMVGNLRIVLGEPRPGALPPRKRQGAETLSANPEAFYRMMDKTGLVYSGPFRALNFIERRFNFSSAGLRRHHIEDSTSLLISPATLDTCLQSAFLSYASPGDRSLWAPFLPTHIDSIRFNIAALRQNTNGGLLVDSQLSSIQHTTQESKAVFTAEIGIFNDKEEMEIQIEGLQVTSIAKTRPEDDYELYLHTVVDVDPTDEIVRAAINTHGKADPLLVETCDRLAHFYLHDPQQSMLGLSSKFSQSTVLQECHSYQPGPTEQIETLVCAIDQVIRDASAEVQFSRHIQRVVQQFVHKFPRMNVLSISAPGDEIEHSILSGLGTTIMSYTMASIDHDAADILPASEGANDTGSRMHKVKLNLDQAIDAQLLTGDSFDLVIMSTSVLRAANVSTTLHNVRAAIRNGGFLILMQLPQSALRAGIRLIADSQPPKFPLSISELVAKHIDGFGFRNVARNADQFYSHDSALAVRQVDHLTADFLDAALKQSTVDISEKLLIIGGTSRHLERLAYRLKDRLAALCGRIDVAESFEEMEPSVLEQCTSTIMLAELSEPVITAMTEKRLSQLKRLLRPQVCALWVTREARSGNPDHAATFGFTRTIAAEVPNLKIQVLDMDTLDNMESLIAEAYTRLIYTDSLAEDRLWIREPEIHIKQGRQMIPRVLPLKEANDRVNAMRRVVSRSINTIQTRVDLITTSDPGGWPRYEAKQSNKDCWANPKTGFVSIQTAYSSAEALKLGVRNFKHVCIGRDMDTSALTVALSSSNASYIRVPAHSTQVITDGYDRLSNFVHTLMRYMTAFIICSQTRGRPAVIVGADPVLLDCVEQIASAQAASYQSWTVSASMDCGPSRSIIVHPKSTDSQLRTLFPPAGCIIYDFSPANGEMSRRFLDLLPSNCEYHPGPSLLSPYNGYETQDTTAIDLPLDSIFREAVSMAAQRASADSMPAFETISVNVLITRKMRQSPINVIDWAIERDTVEVVKPLVEDHLLDPLKTYILIGLTRDFGQSLARLFIDHGARRLVLASRNPNTSPKWAEELSQARGAMISIEKLDVTKLEDVLAFKERMSASMPPVAGIVNGAMILEDRVFSQMTLDNWNRVLRPKTVGSKNLELAFSDATLEFFIMTSSFAAIGGHPGQSNYAAANMYMNGLAANRRRRGLAASVLNIGVIYGLGLLQREKEELYLGLEREGYPPISERDIHHMFLEAIVAGRPAEPNQPMDITTGLSRFQWGSQNPLHWHTDPRFSHFTMSEAAGQADRRKAKVQTSLMEELAALRDIESMTSRMVDAFTERLESLLQLPGGTVNRHSTLPELGIDSLIAVDIRNWVWKTLGRDIAVLKILSAGSIYRFCLDFAKQIHAGTHQADESSSVDTPLSSRTPSEASAPSVATSTDSVEKSASQN